MENTYYPLLDCEGCKKLTRHCFVKTERRTYQCVEDRQGMSKAERNRLEKQAQFDALIYACVECGTQRGYGNRIIEDETK
jgi:hypothetical protein